jgi:hypothetical protein
VNVLLAILTLLTIVAAFAIHRRTRRDPFGGFHDAVDALAVAVARARQADVERAQVRTATVPALVPRRPSRV